jgi:hypothetical protein
MNDEERKNHIYLGDGVYAEKTHNFIVLRTGDHRDEFCSHRIFLDEPTLVSFLEWVQRVVSKEQ